MKSYHILFVTLSILFLTIACKQTIERVEVKAQFTLLPPEYSGVDFENRLVDETDFNVFKYRNYYNGGGVAIGDLNNDGLPDIYLTANQLENRLYLNKGEMRFEDITSTAGVAGTHNWSTGASFVDINADGLLDIYVANSGNIAGDTRANELFINQGNNSSGIPTFKDMAKEYGLDDTGFTTHAAFFDYDRDGDLDAYILNNAFRPLSTFDLSKNLRHERDPGPGGDRFYRNDGDSFTDISEQAGILGSVIAFGLGVNISDLNNDGWLDIYIANDFFERDYLYMNNQDGTFSEKLEEMMRYVSLSSMGADIADFNNDGLMDVIATDMLPEDDLRLKTTFTFDTYDFVAKQIEWGYYHQFSQNTLQINNGAFNNSAPTFTETGFLSGVATTDWSWGAIALDMDNDGWRDIFISNGIFRDVTDQDYLDFLMEEENFNRIVQGDKIDFPSLIRDMPSTRLRNYAFRNNGNLTFSNVAPEWEMDTLSHSNGVAYGDLDLDGDLDLVINNVNMHSFIYRNESDTLSNNNYLRINLRGKGKNQHAIGSTITLHMPDGTINRQEHMPMRGFQSSVDYTLVFGLGDGPNSDAVDVEISWPDGTVSMHNEIVANQTVEFSQVDAKPAENIAKAEGKRIFQDVDAGIDFLHQENKFTDFQRESLLPRMLSTEGPQITVGDINGDRREDLFISGAKTQTGGLFLQQRDGSFIAGDNSAFEKTKISEDVDAAFVDVDGDGDKDLYVVSGGNEYSRTAPALQDRLYLNNGRGKFIEAKDALPKLRLSGACIAPADVDGDGDIDLYIGSRSMPWQYGIAPPSQLLINNGRGKFTNQIGELAPDLERAGMITDADWLDYDSDGDMDLIVVGDWMPVSVFQNNAGKLSNVTEVVIPNSPTGWWTRLKVAKINGQTALIAGNFGYNFKLQASKEEPVDMYVSDFDDNGLIEQLIFHYKQGSSNPLPLLDNLVDQIPAMKNKFSSHKDYSNSTVEDLLTPEQLQKAQKYSVTSFATTVFYPGSGNTFKATPLPLAAQMAPVYAIAVDDFDGDNKTDLLLAGNFYGLTPQLGRLDSGFGTLLSGNGGGSFYVRPSDLSLSGQIRDFVTIQRAGKAPLVIGARNNQSPLVLTY